uniref:uncharacterized protein elfn1a n=1 Tax=Pristiophorus japonicus TaxID=55135 RepID=UPI00398F2E00
MALLSLGLWVSLASLMNAAGVCGDCWLIEGEKGFVWLAICSQNQPPYESIPQHINSTIVDLRLNENKIKSVQYSSLNRFGNLTELNLTKNDISYIEDGAFSAQYNLRVLQLGFNKLRNITEGILRGLGRLEYLYLQANLIEVVSPNSFWECPNVMNIDLSMNRLQTLESSTFLGLAKLSTCELYGNPFYCSCELLGFLKWLVQFNNATRSYDRMQCESPSRYAGHALLSQSQTQSAYSLLVSSCGHTHALDPKFLATRAPPTTATSDSPCGAEDCPSGDDPTPAVALHSPTHETRVPAIKVEQVTYTSATLLVQIPRPFSKMYILVQYNNSFYADIKKLQTDHEVIQLDRLQPHTAYTYCVASIRNALRYNQTCVTFSTGSDKTRGTVPPPSTATHYIMTILGCLFGMVIVLGLVYYCLRKRRQQEEKHKRPGGTTRTIMELKYGAEAEASTISQLAPKPAPPCEAPPRKPCLPSAGEPEPRKPQEPGGTPKTAKGNYIEVRTGEPDDRREPEGGGQGRNPAAEISTIAKEVDKVNQIINNCIDALKSETGPLQGGKAGAVASAEPQVPMVTEQPQGQPGLLSPVSKESYHPLRRHGSTEAAPKRPSTSSSGSARSPRSFHSEPSAPGHTCRSEAQYIEKASPVAAGGGSCPGAVPRAQPRGEHRHSYPGRRPADQPPAEGLGGRSKPSILEPLSRPRRDVAYSQLSPQYHNLSYTSSPQYHRKPTPGIWERFRLHKKRHKEGEEEYMAAGHALRKKVQFAKDEDLHDILDYWKGVSNQFLSPSLLLPILWVSLALLMNAAGVCGDCWLIEGEKGFVWLAICSQNQPPYESIPQHINSTIVDLRLNENKIKSVQYSSLNRFGNLTELNLTKNQISYIEDGAFSAQYNLRVLQLGFNKLRNITEGILRGLGRLEYLYLQANLIEVVSPNSFWECPNVMNIDLSMNRLQTLESSTFLGLAKLSTCELYGNPFYCSCELLGFLKWLVQFNNATRSYDRTQCTSPADLAGYLLLSHSQGQGQGQGQAGSRDALSALASMCNEDLYSIDPHFIFTQRPSTTTVPESPCGADDCPSGEESTPLISFQTPLVKADDTPVIELKQVAYTTATLTVHIPSPGSKGNILVQYNNSMYIDIRSLVTEREDIKIEELTPHTNYTFCVTSIHNSLRYNQTCITFTTRARSKAKPLPAASSTTHYIMTILGCLFGVVIILGVTYYCLRKKKEEQAKSKKPGNAKKTIIELKYAPELETITITQMAQKPAPPSDLMPSRMPFLPSSGELEEYSLQEVLDSPKHSRGNYIDVRTAEHPYHRDILESMFGESQDSAAEISTIAKEVDQVNLIINNCIDALQTESSSFQGPGAGAMASVESQGFLTPMYRDSYHPLKRHSSMDTAPKCPSISSNCSVRSPRSVRSDIYAAPRYKSEAKYIERSSPTPSGRLAATPCRMVRSETGHMPPYGDHSHLYAGLHHGAERKAPRSPSPCVFEPLPRSRSRRNLAYSQFSPQYHSVSYASSPEYSSKPSKGVWERYKPHEKWHRKDEYLAAGYALRKKVQFATDEDLHDILDYWKGVSSQHKS